MENKHILILSITFLSLLFIFNYTSCSKIDNKILIKELLEKQNNSVKIDENLFKEENFLIQHKAKIFPIELNIPVFRKPPQNDLNPNQLILSDIECYVSIGDVLTPVIEYANTNPHYYYVKTATGIKGWFPRKKGLIIDYQNIPKLDFLSHEPINQKDKNDWRRLHYVYRYQSNNGQIAPEHKIIFINHLISLLNGNLVPENWIYPIMLEKAEKIAKYGTEIARDKNSYFIIDKKTNEKVELFNRLAETIVKMEKYKEALDIHAKIIKYYWNRRISDALYAGLSSSVKKLDIYLVCTANNKLDELNIKRESMINLAANILNNHSIRPYAIDEYKGSTASDCTMQLLKDKLGNDDFLKFSEEVYPKLRNESMRNQINVYRTWAYFELGNEKLALKLAKDVNNVFKYRRYSLSEWFSDRNLIHASEKLIKLGL